MDKSTIIKEVTKIIREFLAKDYKVLLFGSWAKGDALETSDIDIGILGKGKIPWDSMVKILQKADGIPTLRKIDIVDLNKVDEVFRNNVLRYAKSL